MKTSATSAPPLSATYSTIALSVDVAVPFWITACVRLMPPRRRNGEAVSASLANAVVLAVQALTADRGNAGLGARLDREQVVRWCGLGTVNKAGWVFDYLEMIGFLTIERHYNSPGQGRAPDTFTCTVTPPASYVGPRTYAELCQVLADYDEEAMPVFALFSTKVGEAR